MWGIVPAAGRGSRIKPLAFSKELLPIGSRIDGESERPVAVSEYLIERMLAAGVKKLCFVISPGKSDILEYYGGRIRGADICYVVQDQPRGLCDALFRALPLVGDDEWIFVGLPDTIWFPANALSALAAESLEFLLFPVERPELFDAVRLDDFGNVIDIRVKSPDPGTSWVWGAFKVRGRELRELYTLWCQPGRGDEYFGTLLNAYVRGGGRARGLRAGRAYADVGTVNGYREASRLIEAMRLAEGCEREGGLDWSKQ
jgi:glucose-1-phosphate thymidylyltransferase